LIEPSLGLLLLVTVVCVADTSVKFYSFILKVALRWDHLDSKVNKGGTGEVNYFYLRIEVREGETMLMNCYMSLISLAEDPIVFKIASWYY